MIIGIDDTDSKNGMCTTYLCAVLVDELRKCGEVSTPRLVRLNPCIPFKTRGNGAVSFEITMTTEKEETVKELVKSRVSEFSELEDDETNPGVVFIGDTALRAMSRGGSDEKIERMLKLKNFYETAVRDVLKIEHAYTLLGVAFRLLRFKEEERVDRRVSCCFVSISAKTRACVLRLYVRANSIPKKRTMGDVTRYSGKERVERR